MNRWPHVFLTIAIIGALIGSPLIFAPSSQAARIECQINGGPLGFILDEQPQLGGVELTGFDQETSGTLGLIDFRDARGTGTGWLLTVQASDFIAADDPSHTIAATGFNISAAPVVTVAGNEPPKSFVGALSAPLTVLDASADTGMGHFNVEPNVTLTIPADVFAGTYDSTLTFTLVSEP